MPAPEPWLRGPLPGLSPWIAPLVRSFEQVREDLDLHTAGLTVEQVWARPHGLASLGFHLRHIAGSIDRLVTYLAGHQLEERQLAALEREHEAGASREVLLAGIEAAMHKAEGIVRDLDPSRLGEVRTVGRRGLPTTAIGLMIHIAEHTQRHTGQALAAAKLARAV